jgi:hypothetical protein
LQKAIRGWLSPPDPWKNHNIAHESHHEATAAWFIQSETFSEWKWSGPSSLLWIHGKRQLMPIHCASAEPDGYYALQLAQARVCFGTLAFPVSILELKISIALQLSRISGLCKNQGWHHSDSSTTISGTIQRKNAMA